MRVRSTGLGKTELVLKPEAFIKKDGYLIFKLKSIEPVNWHVRVLVEPKDLRRLIPLMLKGPIFLWLISLFKKPSAPPEDY